jgi:hypothetical protein
MISIPTLIQDVRIRLDEREAEYFQPEDIRRALSYAQRKVFNFIFDSTEEAFMSTITVPVVTTETFYDLSAIAVATGEISNSYISYVSSYYKPSLCIDYRPKLDKADGGSTRLTLGTNYYMPNQTTFVFTSNPSLDTNMTLYVKKDRPDITSDTGTIDLPIQANDAMVNYAEMYLRQKDESDSLYQFIREDLIQLREKISKMHGSPQEFSTSMEVPGGDF